MQTCKCIIQQNRACCMKGKQISGSLDLKLLGQLSNLRLFCHGMPVVQPLPNYISQRTSTGKLIYDSLKIHLEKLTQLMFS